MEIQIGFTSITLSKYVKLHLSANPAQTVLS